MPRKEWESIDLVPLHLLQVLTGGLAIGQFDFGFININKLYIHYCERNTVQK